MAREGAVVDAGTAGWWSEQERRRVTRLCVAISGDPSSADDLAQETLLEAWRHRHRLVDPTARGPWLDAIARNVCRRWRARRGRIIGREVCSERPEEQPGAAYAGRDELADLLEKEELAELLDRALRLLPVQTREALVARYVEELDVADIGRRLAMSPEAVSMRLSRGRARIRELLETDLSDDPLAQVWVSRHGVAWRTVRVPCAMCGSATSSMRRDERAGVVQARCDRCDPGGLSSSWSLDNPALRPDLTAVSRPSAVVGRMAAWSYGWWPAAIEAGRSACTRCGAAISILPYQRDDRDDPHTSRGWHASCVACGEALSTSLLGLALSRPEARALRARRPRAHAVPTRTTEVDGRAVLVVGLRDDVSGDRVEALYDDATARPLGVVASA
jgi:RNA polymerase sigma-70 factor (ECF subfamily)